MIFILQEMQQVNLRLREYMLLEIFYMYEGKVNLIAGAFQDAANAVNKAKQYIQPDANKFAMVSSHNEIFKKRNKELVKQMMQ